MVYKAKIKGLSLSLLLMEANVGKSGYYYPIAPLVLQYVVHKVHSPSLVYLFRLSAFYSVETTLLATASFADLKMFPAIDS